MPISTEHTKLSIDFAYEWSTPDGQTFEFPMKFLHTAMGPTIQIGSGNDYFELPAEMFIDTAEFLQQQGVLQPKTQLAKKVSKGPLSPPVFTKIPTTQKMPVPEVQPFNALSSQDAQQVEGHSVLASDSTPEIDASQMMKQRLEAKAKATAKKIKKKIGEEDVEMDEDVI